MPDKIFAEQEPVDWYFVITYVQDINNRTTEESIISHNENLIIPPMCGDMLHANIKNTRFKGKVTKRELLIDYENTEHGLKATQRLKIYVEA